MAIKSLSKGKYKSPRGQIVARLLEGTLAGKEYVIGDTDFVRNIATERSERYTNEFAVKTLAYREVDQITAELTITAYQAGKIAKMVAHMSEAAASAEAALADQTIVYEDVDFTDEDTVLSIPARRVSNVVVSDGDAEIYVEGEHYTLTTNDFGKSYVSLIAKPEGAGPDVSIDYDRLASAADRYNFSSLTELMVELVFLENVKPTAGRTAETHVYHKVGLTVDGDYTLIGSDSAPRTVTIKGTIYPDTTKPQPLGYVEDGIKAAA